MLLSFCSAVHSFSYENIKAALEGKVFPPEQQELQFEKQPKLLEERFSNLCTSLQRKMFSSKEHAARRNFSDVKISSSSKQLFDTNLAHSLCSSWKLFLRCGVRLSFFPSWNLYVSDAKTTLVCFFSVILKT